MTHASKTLNRRRNTSQPVTTIASDPTIAKTRRFRDKHRVRQVVTFERLDEVGEG